MIFSNRNMDLWILMSNIYWRLFKSNILYNNSKELLYKIIHTLESSKSLNPYRSSWRKITLKIFLYFVFGILFLMFSYLWIGIFIFFLADPVICFLYGYSIMYQLWWRGGRVGMEMIVEFRKSRPLEKYIKKLNQ